MSRNRGCLALPGCFWSISAFFQNTRALSSTWSNHPRTWDFFPCSKGDGASFILNQVHFRISPKAISCQKPRDCDPSVLWVFLENSVQNPAGQDPKQVTVLMGFAWSQSTSPFPHFMLDSSTSLSSVLTWPDPQQPPNLFLFLLKIKIKWEALEKTLAGKHFHF